MDNLNDDIKNKILEIIKQNPIGASSSEIAKKINHNRVTVTKYLEIMKAYRLVEYKEIAQAKLWTISKQKNTNKTILIVDDEPHISELIKLSLISGKYELLQVYDGKTALFKIIQDHPDLIILDLMMPGMNGYEVCKSLKENDTTKNIPVLILSAKAEMTDKIKGLNVGADDYITKPFDPQELEARVKLLLQKSGSTSNLHSLTQLPNKTAILEKHSVQKNYTVVICHIKNLEYYKKNYGLHKTNEAIKLIANMINSKLKDADSENLLGHSENDEFIMMVKNTEVLEIIKKLFENMIPFLYKEEDHENDKNLLKLDIEIQKNS